MYFCCKAKISFIYVYPTDQTYCCITAKSAANKINNSWQQLQFMGSYFET